MVRFMFISFLFLLILCDTLTIFQVHLAWFGHGLCKLVDFDSFIRLSCSFSDLLSASLHLFSLVPEALGDWGGPFGVLHTSLAEWWQKSAMFPSSGSRLLCYLS